MGLFDKLENAILKIGDNLDVDKQANRIIPNKKHSNKHSGPQVRTEPRENKPQWRAVCQDCGMVGGIVHHVSGVRTDGPPQGQPVLAGFCKSHVSGKSNVPHRAKWEKY